MKGKNKFTKTEVSEIETLIALKLVSSRNKQKGIRAKIRKIGFYYSNYSSSKHGYTIGDFRSLIKMRNIIVAG